MVGCNGRKRKRLLHLRQECEELEVAKKTPEQSADHSTSVKSASHRVNELGQVLMAPPPPPGDKRVAALQSEAAKLLSQATDLIYVSFLFL